MKFRLIVFGILFSMQSASFAQSSAPENWFNLDQSTDNIPGVSSEKTYNELLKGRTSETVVVAVIDSGVDYNHEDLKAIMWINDGEIAGDGIDNDGNGYIDDIHGWNFIGGKDGKNVNHDALEVTRLYAHYKKMFDGKDKSTLSKKEKKKYDKYIDVKEAVEKKRESLAPNLMSFSMILDAYKSLEKHFGKADFSADEMDAIDTEDETLAQSVTMVKDILNRQPGASPAALKDMVQGAYDYYDSQTNYHYNPDYDPRSIVGDDYSNLLEKDYGNNDYQGPDANHGTHVSGIIGAVRTNDVGMKGVADNVRIMSVRCVPDGDERDKDVANAIRYAVDNGAQIINMSFGKSYVWDKDIVDKAVKYALKKDVLLVHAAGNDGGNTDFENNFPNDKFQKKGLFGPKYAKKWIEVGALNWKGGEDLAATFSNYGKENVDLFAPGVDIYSTTVGNEYDAYPGTSMASPMVAGVAAMLRSYFPELTARQVKDILMESSIKITDQVNKPGSKGEKVSFSELSQTGGMVNSFTAVKKAMTVKGKKKIKKAKESKVVRP